MRKCEKNIVERGRSLCMPDI